MCQTCNWKAALETIAETKERLEEITEGNDSDAASDFCFGVGERLDDMAAWIEENRHVTEPQEQAIENMAAAAGRWVR